MDIYKGSYINILSLQFHYRQTEKCYHIKCNAWQTPLKTQGQKELWFIMHFLILLRSTDCSGRIIVLKGWTYSTNHVREGCQNISHRPHTVHRNQSSSPLCFAARGSQSWPTGMWCVQRASHAVYGTCFQPLWDCASAQCQIQHISLSGQWGPKVGSTVVEQVASSGAAGAGALMLAVPTPGSLGHMLDPAWSKSVLKHMHTCNMVPGGAAGVAGAWSGCCTWCGLWSPVLGHA